MTTKTVVLALGAVLLAVAGYVLNKKAAIPMAPGGAGPELNTEPG